MRYKLNIINITATLPSSQHRVHIETEGIPALRAYGDVDDDYDDCEVEYFGRTA